MTSARARGGSMTSARASDESDGGEGDERDARSALRRSRRVPSSFDTTTIFLGGGRFCGGSSGVYSCCSRVYIIRRYWYSFLFERGGPSVEAFADLGFRNARRKTKKTRRSTSPHAIFFPHLPLLRAPSPGDGPGGLGRVAVPSLAVPPGTRALIVRRRAHAHHARRRAEPVARVWSPSRL